MRLEDLVNLRKRAYRKLTKTEKLRVIGLRYGSMTDFSRTVRTTTHISKMCYISFSTVARIIKKFEASGYRLDQVHCKRPRTYAVIPEHIKAKLLN